MSRSVRSSLLARYIVDRGYIVASIFQFGQDYPFTRDNNSWATVGEFEISSEDVIVDIVVTVMAKKDGGEDCAKWKANATFVRHDAGDLSQVGPLSTMIGSVVGGLTEKHTNDLLLAWDTDVSEDNSGANPKILFKFKGLSGIDIFGGVHADITYTVP